MHVLRSRYSNGITQDEISCQYDGDIEVMHRNNPNWPGNGFYLTFQQWKDGMKDAPAGHQQLRMFGAEILLCEQGEFIVTGFVADSNFTGQPTKYTMERWYVYARRPR